MRKLVISLVIGLVMAVAIGAIGCAEKASLIPTPTSTPAPTPLPVIVVPQPPVGFLTYNDVVNNFAIHYPEDWEMIPKERIGFALVGFWNRQPNATLNSFLVMKADLPYEINVEDYFESEKVYFHGEYSHYAPISTSTLTLNGKSAIKHTWTFTLDGDTRKYVRLYMVENDTVWVLEAGCYEESFNSYKNAYDTMMSGFHILSQ